MTYEQWIRCNSMIVSWLLNSIVPELPKAFLYTGSALELWTELTERFGQNNGPLLYQVQKDISVLYQGNDSVAVYYTKLKKLWAELDDLSEIPLRDCVHKPDCTAVRKSRDLDRRQRLMHFLMRLNDGYEAIRGQILLMDPLPTVNQAYCMIARVETQRHVTGSSGGGLREIAATVKTTSPPLVDVNFASPALYAKGVSAPRPKRDSKKPKPPRFCDHCQRTGHTQDQCFKLIGYPDWYDGPRENTKGRKGTNWLQL